MKKLLLTTLSILMLFSCSGDSVNAPDTTPQNVLVKWKFKFNGVLYQWEGSSDSNSNTNNLGHCSHVLPTQQPTDGFIQLGKPNIDMNFEIPNNNIGNHILNSVNFGNSFSFWINNEYYATSQLGGPTQVNLNISQMPTAIGGIVKGTFYGTVRRGYPPSAPSIRQITEGYFEAVRE